jgi:hypothetical protein
MQFTNDAMVKPHVDTSKLFACAKLSDSGLSSPTTFLLCFSNSCTGHRREWAYLNSDMGISKAPAHVWQTSRISCWWSQHIRILPLSVPVSRSQHGGTIAVPPWQGLQVLPIRINLMVIVVPVLSSIGRLSIKRLDSLLVPVIDWDRQARACKQGNEE